MGEPAERHRGIPFPGTFVVDRQGRVTSRFFEDAYWERNTVSNIMARVGTTRTPVQVAQASTAHLDAKAYVTDGNIALGSKFSVVVDITPKRGMHVYAPGAASYRVVSLRIDPQQYVRIQPRPYPRSEIYHFVPLNERVPVYQRPFTLGADVVAEATAEARKALTGRNELVLTGALEYQACDDKICYNPASIPLTWKVALQPFVPAAPQPPR